MGILGDMQDFQWLGATEDVFGGSTTSDGVSVSVDDAQLADLMAANEALPTDTESAMKEKMADATGELSAEVAASFGHRDQSSLMIPTVHDDHEGSVTAGGALPVGRHRKPAGALLAGIIWGSNRYHQFPPSVRPATYSFFNAFDANQEHLYDKMSEAADDAIDLWGAEGSVSDADTLAKKL